MMFGFPYILAITNSVIIKINIYISFMWMKFYVILLNELLS